MLLATDLDQRRDLAVVRLRGDVTAADFQLAVRELVAQGGFAASRRLWDFTGCRTEMSSESLKALSDEIRSLDGAPARVAFVADGDAAFGIARMAGVFRETAHTETSVFRDEARALAWLFEAPGSGGGG